MASLKTATLFAALKDAGVTNVEIRYDGGGDSGQVEDVDFHGDNIDDADLNSKFEGDLQDLATHLLEQHYDYDWYNNDGGYGTITIELLDEPVILIDGYVRSLEDAHGAVNIADIDWGE
jgi:hypothetical protein